jgi:hypothetical protein
MKPGCHAGANRQRTNHLQFRRSPHCVRSQLPPVMPLPTSRVLFARLHRRATQRPVSPRRPELGREGEQKWTNRAARRQFPHFGLLRGTSRTAVLLLNDTQIWELKTALAKSVRRLSGFLPRSSQA